MYIPTEWLILNIILSSALFLYDGKPSLDRLTTIMRCMIISSFAKLFAIPALIWAQTQSTNYLALTYLFLLTSNITALKGKFFSFFLFSHFITFYFSFYKFFFPNRFYFLVPFLNRSIFVFFFNSYFKHE